MLNATCQVEEEALPAIVINSNPVVQPVGVYQKITLADGAVVAAGTDITLRAIDEIVFGDNMVIAGDFTAKLVDKPLVTDPNFTNNMYDAIGNITGDQQGGVTVEWTVYGKVKRVTHEDGTIVDYKYDGAGNRISKVVTPSGGPAVSTHYVRDASGNTMAIYADGALGEQPIYGSSRVGNYVGETDPGDMGLGRRRYELNNHLGNVLAVVTDRLINDAGDIRAEPLSNSDYYPFGLEIDPRGVSTEDYRYGFNGKEKDPNMNTDVHYDYGFRIYNPRVARFLSTDPLTGSYPELTPYQFASNTPIQAIDLDGLEAARPYFTENWKLNIEFTSSTVSRIQIIVPDFRPKQKVVTVREVFIGPAPSPVEQYFINVNATKNQVDRFAAQDVVTRNIAGSALIVLAVEPLLISNFKTILGKATLDAFNQTIINGGDVERVDWVNVAASGLIKNPVAKNLISSLADFSSERGFNKDENGNAKNLNQIVNEFIIRTGADILFDKSVIGPTSEFGKRIDLQREVAQDLLKKYTRRVAGEAVEGVSGSNAAGTPEN